MSLTRVVVMTLASSTQPEAARKLAELAASSRGRAIFARRGFTMPHGKLAGSLMVSCAAGVREPIAALAASFEKDTGVKVELSYANSGQLLGQIAASKIGDVFIPGDLGFIQQAKTKGLSSDDGHAFCRFIPTIYVRKGNPKGIATLADLTKPGVKLALAEASSAVGALQAKVFEKNKIDQAALKTNTVTSPATVNEVALAVKLGSADAGIVWNALANFAPAEAEVVAIPDDQNVTATVAACVLSGSKNPEAALAFIFRLISPEGQKILASKGFSKP
jgi:molybdate transport system substrate-binding protein